MNEKKAIETLKQIKEVFDKHGIKYWLDWGTLLGAVRDGKFIPWDHDIDIGTWKDEIEKFFPAFEELKLKGFNVRFTENDNSIALFKDSKKTCFISVTIYEVEKNKAVKRSLINDKHCIHYGNSVKIKRSYVLLVYLVRYIIWLLHAPKFIGDKPAIIPSFLHISLVKLFRFLPSIYRQEITKFVEIIASKFGFKYLKVEVPLNYFEEFSEIDFYGMKFKVPSKTEEYLAYKYGEDWRIPKKDYIYYLEDGTICRG